MSRREVKLSCCDLQGRKIIFTNSKTLVGVATERDARNACLRFFSFYFSCVVVLLLAFLAILFACFWKKIKKKHEKHQKN